MSASLTQQAVGEYVRRLRTGRSLSVRELAARTGFSPSFISQVENGQASPSISSGLCASRCASGRTGRLIGRQEM
jgi:ribosome-binding protein aMBF1 (putative translation factor)